MQSVRILMITLFALLLSSALLGAVPNPVVFRPIPADPPGDPLHNYPFFASDLDLAANGYVEEEYFFEGFANRYFIPGPIDTAMVIDGGHFYRTRMIVRRPAASALFNGTVIMEWQNDAVGFDLDSFWLTTYEHLMRRGYAWIGVTTFAEGIHSPYTGLRDWSPLRYGSLDLTAEGAFLNNELAFDVFSQAAQAVKSPEDVDPMGGLPVARIFAIGGSLSADLGIVPYFNSIHPLAGVFDGFFVVIGGETQPLRTDLDTNVFKLWSETEAARSTPDGRQPDSEHLRRWEVAGAAHYGWEVEQAIRPLRIRDIGLADLPTDCELPPFSRVPFNHVLHAAFDQMVEWVEDGIAPPQAPEIPVLAFGTPNELARDSYGNALGGIQLAEHDIATANNTGVNGPFWSFCPIFGSYEPFSSLTLGTLYPTHGSYVRQVSGVAAQNVRDGYLVQEDADETVGTAAQSNVGKQ